MVWTLGDSVDSVISPPLLRFRISAAVQIFQTPTLRTFAMAQFPLELQRLVQYLGGVDGQAFRGVSAAVGLNPLPLLEQLKAMTKKANAAQALHVRAKFQLAAVAREVALRRIRDRDEAGDYGDSDDSEFRDISCETCGRRGGNVNMYNMRPGDFVLCSRCEATDPRGAVVESFF
jgi:hypothetical protein